MVYLTNDRYAEWEGRGNWNFMEELKKYCINDVECLVGVMKKYHDILMEKTKMTPWHNTTAPSFVHEVYTRTLSRDLELPDPKEDEARYQEIIQEAAWHTHWGVLTESEYWFARKALRGGRTDVRKIYHKVSDEDWARGHRIRYQDICSQYPYQQAVHKFPTGLPTIHYWDPKYAPCITHKTELCRCSEHPSPQFRNPLIDRSCRVLVNPTLPTVEELMAEDDEETGFENPWFGIVCATVVPPRNLFHPVLVHYDSELNKSVASCEPILEGVFTSIEFKKALQMGYRMTTLHRFDMYNKKLSLWSDTIKDLYIEKMVNSGPKPSEEDQERLIREYEEEFDMGDALRDTFTAEDRWGKNPAMKITFKILLNSGWGKHCQRPYMTESVVIDEEAEAALVNTFFQNCISEQFQFMDAVHLGPRTMYRYQKNSGKSKVDLHQSYLPAALFVPAYGRMHLWEQMNKLGKRVLMNDTDSIIYIYKPEEYNIPESDVWGGWEVEDIDRNNEGIRTFVGLGPKSYALECEKDRDIGKNETLVKFKGLSLKRATEDLVNFKVMEELVLEHLQGLPQRTLRIPQTNFNYRFGRGMNTHRMLKDLKFNADQLKGVLQPDGTLNPFGYESE